METLGIGSFKHQEALGLVKLPHQVAFNVVRAPSWAHDGSVLHSVQAGRAQNESQAMFAYTRACWVSLVITALRLFVSAWRIMVLSK